MGSDKMPPEPVCTAVVLAGGSGKRMGGSVKKQYLSLGGVPLLVHSLRAFEACPFIRDLVLVTGEGQEDYCRREIVERFGISKVSRIVPGGAERYDSVYQGLLACREPDYVFIHDSARPFLDQEMLARGLEGVKRYGACALGMPSKDTVNLTDEEGAVVDTPPRSAVWIVQTPQIFSYDLIRRAHESLRQEGALAGITDDVMVVRKALGTRVHMIPGAYTNLKITTPEDLPLAETLLAAAPAL